MRKIWEFWIILENLKIYSEFSEFPKKTIVFSNSVKYDQMRTENIAIRDQNNILVEKIAHLEHKVKNVGRYEEKVNFLRLHTTHPPGFWYGKI